MHPILEQILIQRGIVSPEDIQEFLADKPKRHYDPLLLKGMQEGVTALLTAVSRGEKITVYGDYDADGVTATVIMLTVLSALGADVNYYIPSRFDEGYGLNRNALDRIRAAGTSLVVTVDCGCNAVEEVEYAKEIGLSILITDHHTCGEPRPDTTVIDPKQPGCPYPFKELAGCGVAYKVALALRDAAGLSKEVTNEVLDMVAIGTIGDVVSLTDENRTLVKYGLAKIRQGRRPGLAALKEQAGLSEGPLTGEDVSFRLVPPVNAAGRMGSAKLGVRLFTAGPEEAPVLAEQLLCCNEERKQIQQQILRQCLAMKETEIDPFLFPVLVAEGAHEGITGIVAGRLREMFQKPIAIIVPGEDGMGKGTSRSVDRLDLFEILSVQSDLFTRFGGHRGACGFTLPMEHVDELRESLQQDMEFMLFDEPDLLEPLNSYDLALSPKDLTMELAEALTLLEPCGSGNERPVFLLEDVPIRQTTSMGTEGQHLRILFGDPPVTGVLFRVDEESRAALREGGRADLTGTLAVHEWQQRRSLQFMIKGVNP